MNNAQVSEMETPEVQAARARVETAKAALKRAARDVRQASAHGLTPDERIMWKAFDALSVAEDAYRLVRYGYAQTFPHPLAFRR